MSLVFGGFFLSDSSNSECRQNCRLFLEASYARRAYDADQWSVLGKARHTLEAKRNASRGGTQEGI